MKIRNLILLISFLMPLLYSCVKDDCDDYTSELNIIYGEWTIKIDDASGTVVINVEGDQGVVSDPGTSSYSAGDVIWKDIIVISPIRFSFEEMNPGGTYNTAQITVINEWIIEIKVDNGTGGNIKRAAKDGVKYDTLEGTWRRVESNNPINDNMLIKIIDNYGTIVDRANSPSFLNGDIKWKAITPDSENTFNYEELGSDKNYYTSTMTIINDSVLNISVFSAGAGNIQKWIRNGTGASTGPLTAQLLDCNAMKSALSLKNGPSEIDYIIDCVMDITAPVIVEPGVVISFNENAGLGVYDSGSLNMKGTADQPIILKGNSPVKGFWRGIHLETSSVSNQFENVIISDAGSNYVYCCNLAATLFNKGGKLGLKNVSIANGAGVGISTNLNAKFTMFENIVVTTHDKYPLSISVNTLNDIGDENSNFSGNVKDYIYITSDAISSDIVWPKANIPYLVEKDVVDITHGMQIEAGAEIAFEENGGLGVYNNGTLTISGEEGNTVILRGLEDTDGFWRGIHLETNSLLNSFEHLSVKNAGNNYVYCCNEPAAIFLKSGKCKLDHVSVESATVGIYASNDFKFNGYSNISVLSNKEPLKIAMERAGEIDVLSTYSSTDNTYDYISFIKASVSKATSIKVNASATPYLIDFVVDIKSPLTIDPGVEMVFKENGGLGVYDDGIIKISGTASDQVILRGFEDIVGYWRGIHTETNSINNLIKHTVISNAGLNYVYCCNIKSAVFVRGGALRMENNLIQKSGNYGIYIKTGAQLTEFGNSYSENNNENIFYE